MTEVAAEKHSRSFRMPHTLVIVGALVVIVLLMSWIIPSGTYDRVEKDGRMVTVSGTYKQVEKDRLGRRRRRERQRSGFFRACAVAGRQRHAVEG